MVDTKKLSESLFLTIEKIQSSPTKMAVIISEGHIESYDGRERVQILVEIDGKKFQFAPNSTTLKRIWAVWGYESREWVGKKISFKIELTQRGRESINGYPEA